MVPKHAQTWSMTDFGHGLPGHPFKNDEKICFHSYDLFYAISRAFLRARVKYLEQEMILSH